MPPRLGVKGRSQPPGGLYRMEASQENLPEMSLRMTLTWLEAVVKVWPPPCSMPGISTRERRVVLFSTKS